MSEHRQRICALAEEAASEADPESALRTLVELRRELDAFVGVQVERGLAAGASFADVARALGISRQAAGLRRRRCSISLVVSRTSAVTCSLPGRDAPATSS